MIELMNKVRRDVESELLTACEKYNLFASRHEGMAVIEEEIFEVKEDVRKLEENFDTFRYNVFTDEYDTIDDDIELIRTYAELLACEAIQVAAMCRKWEKGFLLPDPNKFFKTKG